MTAPVKAVVREVRGHRRLSFSSSGPGYSVLLVEDSAQVHVFVDVGDERLEDAFATHERDAIIVGLDAVVGVAREKCRLPSTSSHAMHQYAMAASRALELKQALGKEAITNG